MPARTLFPGARSGRTQTARPNTANRPRIRNEAGGVAYARDPKLALATYAATGMLGSTAHSSDEQQVETVLDLVRQVIALPDGEAFVAKAAVYGRKRGGLKDMPALLLAALCGEKTQHSLHYAALAAPQILDNGRMVRNFVQILRSGKVGRRSLGHGPRRMVRHFLDSQNTWGLLLASIGEQPSLADVIKLVHPNPAKFVYDQTRQGAPGYQGTQRFEQCAQRSALYAWLIGKNVDESLLPDEVQRWERLKRLEADGVEVSADADLRGIPFERIISLKLSPGAWQQVAKLASWQQTRANLNTFARHNVFTDKAVMREVVTKLMDPERVRKARVMPYTLFNAARHLDKGLPKELGFALEAATEVALENVPELPGQVVILLDVSGSMGYPLSGDRFDATSTVRNIDVAALLVAALLRKNPATKIVRFNTHASWKIGISPGTSWQKNVPPSTSLTALAHNLSQDAGGGTDLGCAMRFLIEHAVNADFVLYVSDNQSHHGPSPRDETGTMAAWKIFRAANPQARLAFLDIQPTATSQMVESPDVLHIGGMSDSIWEMLSDFAENGNNARRFIDRIEEIAL